jgi:hypothetical protein
MLAASHYDQDYIDRCRGQIASAVADYDELVAAARALAPKGDARLDSALAAFEKTFFTNLVQVLDRLFVHRTRNLEGKDGNPLNEVRVLCNSVMHNGGALVGDKQIKLKPETSVLGYSVGDPIEVDEHGFERLADGFFTEIESRFGA